MSQNPRDIVPEIEADLPLHPKETFFALQKMAAEEDDAQVTLVVWEVEENDKDGTASEIQMGTVDQDKGPETRCVPRLDENSRISQQTAFQMRHSFARGGSGEIWEAVQNSLGRLVAVKRMRARKEESDSWSVAESQRRSISFKQEALVTANLEHPNIVPIYDLGLDENGLPLLAMKLIRGAHWDKTIQHDFDQMLPEDFLARHIPILLSVCQAVSFAHSRGIAHRDIKASQVMVGEFGEVLLTDWGLAVTFDEELLRRSPSGDHAVRFTPSLATAVSPAGTPACMAPEQTLNDAGNIGPWTDIYLIGGILYLLLTGSMPHEAGTSKEAFRRAMMGHVESPIKRASPRDVSQTLAELTMRCLDPEHENRPKSVVALIEELQGYLSGAGKRKESRLLTDAIIEEIAGYTDDYKDFSHGHEKLIRAMTLWPNNPQIKPLQEYLYSSYARAAIRKNDLNLAEIQALNIPNADRREEILAEVREQQSKASRYAKERKQLVIAFLILLVASGFGVYILKDLERQSQEDAVKRRADQEQASVASDRAQAQKQIADTLREYTLIVAAQNDLDRQLARMLPMPTSLTERTVNGVTFEPNFEKVEEILSRQDSLEVRMGELRSMLSAEDKNLLAEKPEHLRLGDLIIDLYRADTQRDWYLLEQRFDDIITEIPQSPLARIGAAIVNSNMGDYMEARASIGRAIELSSEKYGEHHPLTITAKAMRDEIPQ